MSAPDRTEAVDADFSVGLAPRTHEVALWAPGATVAHYLAPVEARALAARLIDAAKSAEYMAERVAEKAGGAA